MNSRERILAVMEGRKPDRLPVMPITMMFAADNAGIRYREYATNHEALVEAQLKVARDFGLDYVSAISDPAREAADCGAKIRFFDDAPPAIDEEEAVLADKGALNRLKRPDPRGGGRMTDRIRAEELFRKRGGELLVEGWVEGPCAEGADLRGINRLMEDFYEDPDFVRDLFGFVTAMELDFARAQVDAGVHLIGVGDAAASLTGPKLYEQFVWPHEKRMVDGIHAMGAKVRLHICGNTRPLLPLMGKLGADLVDLDYFSPMAEGREAMGPRQALLGNLDPVRVVRDGTPDAVREALARCHREAGFPYIAGAGCEIPRGTPAVNMGAFREYALATGG